MWGEDDVAAVLINPFYAVSIDPDLAGQHEAIVSQERWIEANTKLIGKIGPGEWLRRLLAVLEGDYPASPGGPAAAYGYVRDE